MTSQAPQPKDLPTHFSQKAVSDHPQGWEELWTVGLTPWDKSFPSPALVDLLEERGDLLPSNFKQGRKKALVAGCGRGYDVLLLSAFGYDAYGLDFSATALEEARKVENELGGKGVYETREGRVRESVTWIVGDFFKDGWLEGVVGEKVFDLIYDYTFMSALPPLLRPQWADRYVKLLAQEGRLVCLEFPTHKPIDSGGPPWALPPRVYAAHLPRPGKVLPYGEDGDLVESEIGEPSSNGLKCVEHFKPRRTHEIGTLEDGSIADWIGVWTHPS